MRLDACEIFLQLLQTSTKPAGEPRRLFAVAYDETGDELSPMIRCI